mmetsp:Transcript_14113/g.48560  ORF Transcript_14113/g.48560 Transcript_14113/m.48560 type:complete len:104 (-) Transcript_14113:102-413(-)
MLMNERRDFAVQKAIEEGVNGGLEYGAKMSACLLVLKGLEHAGLLKPLMINPFFAFHTRVPAMCFYMTAAGASGFWFKGSAALMRNKYHPTSGDVHEFKGETS